MAAAIWYPYRAWPADRVLAWARDSYDVFGTIAADQPESGVRMQEGTEVVSHRDEKP